MKKYLCIIGILLLSSCANNYSPEEQAYIASVEKFRQEKEEWMNGSNNITPSGFAFLH